MAEPGAASLPAGEPPPPSFHVPRWAAAPKAAACALIDAETGRRSDVNTAPYTTIGRQQGDDAATSLVPEGAREKGVSRMHAAIVHHEDGRVYVIDLKSAKGTTVDGKRIEAFKPKALKHNAELVLGRHGDTAGVAYRVELEGAPDDTPTKKRPRDDADDAAGPKEVRASHLLVKHRDVRNPRSWKEDPVTRTLDEAKAMVTAFREQIVAKAAGGGPVALKAAFEELAATESHCSSAKRPQAGDLGVFTRGKMQPAFEQGAFALQVNELSDLVYSDSGVHIILRTS